MKNALRNALIVLLSFSSAAYAASGSGNVEGTLLLTLFLGFFSLLVVFQVVPAFLLFAGMLKGFMGRDDKRFPIQ